MTSIINVSDFRNNIADYINKIKYNNDTFLLKKGKSIVAKITFYQQKDVDINDKIAKYAGVWSEKDAAEIKKHMKKFRKSFRLIDNKYL